MTNFRNAVFLSTALVFGTTGATFAQETATTAETETVVEAEAVETQSDGGEAAETKEHGGEAATSKEHGGKPMSAK